MRVVFLILLSFSLGLNVFAQNFKYEVILLNKKIGDLNVSKTNSNGTERYLLNSESMAKVLFMKQSSKINFDVLFNSGSLVKSLYIIEKDDEHIRTQVHKEDNLYKVNSNNTMSSLKENIRFSSVMLYFKEPVGVSKVFIERIGGFVTITKSAANQYEYQQPDGTKCIYRYQSGVLKELEIKRSMGSIYIRKTV